LRLDEQASLEVAMVGKCGVRFADGVWGFVDIRADTFSP
jgi:hypothetical protein